MLRPRPRVSARNPVTRGSCAARGRDHRSAREAAQIPQQRGESAAGRRRALRGGTALGRVPRHLAGGGRRAGSAAPAATPPAPRPARTRRGRTGRTRPRGSAAAVAPAVAEAAARPRSCCRPGAPSTRSTSRRRPGSWRWPGWSGWSSPLGPVTCTPDRRMLFFVLPGAAAKVPDLVRKLGWPPASLDLVARGEGATWSRRRPGSAPGGCRPVGPPAHRRQPLAAGRRGADQPAGLRVRPGGGCGPRPLSRTAGHRRVVRRAAGHCQWPP